MAYHSTEIYAALYDSQGLYSSILAALNKVFLKSYKNTSIMHNHAIKFASCLISHLEKTIEKTA
jgi:hypothetical protein